MMAAVDRDRRNGDGDAAATAAAGRQQQRGGEIKVAEQQPELNRSGSVKTEEAARWRRDGRDGGNETISMTAALGGSSR